MSDDPNQIARLRRTGVLTQVTSVDLSGEGTIQALNPTEFTQAQFTERMHALMAQVDPAYMNDLESMILNHLQDRNNPHNDQLSSLVSNIGAELFADYVPGTIPMAAPLYAYDPTFSAMLPLSVLREGPVTVVGRDGLYQSVAANMPAITWETGRPELLLWPAKSQILIQPNPRGSTELQGIGTQLSSSNITGTPTPDNSGAGYVTVLEQGGSATEHGFRITTNLTANGEYCASVHLYSRVSGGFLALRFSQRPNEISFYDLTLREFVSESPFHICHVRNMFSGIDRIGFSFVATSSGSGYVDILYCPTADIAGLAYVGINAKPLFQLFGMNVTTGEGLAPYIPSYSSLASTTAQLVVPSVVTGKGIIAIGYRACRSLQTRDYTIAHAGVNISFMLNGTQQRSILRNRIPAVESVVDIQNDHDAVTVASFSTQRAITRHTGNGRVVTNATLADISNYGVVTLGPFPGGVFSVVGYPVDDSGQVCEFLTGEKLT